MTLPADYTGPSPAALKIPTPDGTEIVLDIHEWPDSIIRPLALLLLEKKGGVWDFMTGTSTNSIWNEDEDSIDQYAHPDGTSMSGSVLDILNHYGYRMITDYVPAINALLATRFKASVATAPGGGAPPTFPFTTVTDARQALAAGLGALLAPQLGADGVPRLLVKAA